MAYSLANNTIKVTADAKVQIIDRAETTIKKTVDLNNGNVKIFISNTDPDDFDIVGTTELEGDYLSKIDPANNDVKLLTDGELINIGQSATIELENFNAWAELDSDEVKFYEEQRVP